MKRRLFPLLFASALLPACSSDPVAAPSATASPADPARDAAVPSAPTGAANGDPIGADGGSSGAPDAHASGDASSAPPPADAAPAVNPCLFPCDSPWYKDVSALPAYTAEDIIGAIGQWGRANKFWIDFAFVPLYADASTPRYTFKLDPSYDPDNDHDPVPVPDVGSLEDEHGYSCTNGGDCHLIVVDTSTNKLFEIWQANLAGGVWTGTQQTTWDLTKHYGPDGRGEGCTSADAAGLAILPGLLRPTEVASGEIHHAIRFILPGTKIMKNGWVPPATHSTNVYSGAAPMGTRLRLKPSFDESTLPSEGAKVVARALKKYGMILADAGQDALTAERDDYTPVKWGTMLGSGDLVGLTVQDFEVVEFANVSAPKSIDCTRN